MSGIFLDRPLALVPPREDFGRQSADGLGQAFRRAPEPLQKFGRRIRTEAELKLAVDQRRGVAMPPTNRGIGIRSTNLESGWNSQGV